VRSIDRLGRLAWLRRRGDLVVVLLVVAVAAAVRLRLAGVPLERDEGEYGYAAQLILHGVPPYGGVYNMKFPGTYYAYSAIIALFGDSARGVHLGLLLVNAATVVVLLSIGRRLLGPVGGAVAASTFAILSLDRWLNAIFAHATHFVLLPALSGLLLLLRAAGGEAGRWTIFASGALLGGAVLMKQHAIVYVPVALLWLLANDLHAKVPHRLRRAAARGAVLALGLATPFAVLCAVLAGQGVFGRFWFWTFDYARAYVSQYSLDDMTYLLDRSWYGVSRVSKPIWVVGAAGLPALWLFPWPLPARTLLTAWAMASFAAICPGFYFRPHYYILLLPSVGLLTGVLVVSLERTFARIWSPRLAAALAVLPCVLVLAQYVHRERAYLFKMRLPQVSRQVYGRNPFLEAVEIARYLREHTTPDDRVVVIGSEPEIYFYARRRSATGYIYTYPLMESHPYAERMQREMIREIETAHPAYAVLVGRWAWNITPDSNTMVLDWADRYLDACYETAGVMDLGSLDFPVWLWDSEARIYQPRSPYVIRTYQRKSSAPCVAHP
jgi:dolichyl-phosphate-mannose-protein mannosyltransferase